MGDYSSIYGTPYVSDRLDKWRSVMIDNVIYRGSHIHGLCLTLHAKACHNGKPHNVTQELPVEQ